MQSAGSVKNSLVVFTFTVDQQVFNKNHHTIRQTAPKPVIQDFLRKTFEIFFFFKNCNVHMNILEFIFLTFMKRKMVIKSQNISVWHPTNERKHLQASIKDPTSITPKSNLCLNQSRANCQANSEIELKFDYGMQRWGHCLRHYHLSPPVAPDDQQRWGWGSKYNYTDSLSINIMSRVCTFQTTGRTLLRGGGVVGMLLENYPCWGSSLKEQTDVVKKHILTPNANCDSLLSVSPGEIFAFTKQMVTASYSNGNWIKFLSITMHLTLKGSECFL